MRRASRSRGQTRLLTVGRRRSTSEPRCTSLEIGDLNAAAGNAIDAGINAADAVAGVNLGRRWKGAHEQASQFVSGAGADGRDVAKQLRRLLPLKTQSHYSAEPVSRAKATAWVDTARRAVVIARRVTARADAR